MYFSYVYIILSAYTSVLKIMARLSHRNVFQTNIFCQSQDVTL